MAIKKPLVVYSGSIEELHDADSIDVAVAGTLPTGGAAGQILAKVDATDYNAEWIDNYATELKLYVKNGTGSTINKGEVVYISGSDGNNALISKAQANSDTTSATTIGFLETTLAAGDHGFVIIAGKLDGLDTSIATAGDPIWLSPTTAGAVLYGMANKPVAPDHLVYLGTVKRVQSVNGEIDIRVQNGYELDELHDVMAVGATSGQILIKDAVLSVWKAITINGTTGEVDVTSTKDGITISLPNTISASITGNAATVTNGLYTTDLGVSVQAYDADLSAIAGLAGTSGFLKKTALNTWTLDTSTYLTAETDPIFGASPAAGITSTNISNWNTAYSWGNHASAGYLTSSAIGVSIQAYDADIPTVSATQAEMEAGTEAALRSMSPLRIKQAIQSLAGAGGFSNMDIITASTTWAVPAGVTKAKITVVGGGGGGSGNKTPSIDCGAFGGNGGVAIALVTGLSGSYTVTIGAGGAGGTGGTGTSTGGNGGNTSFGSILSATGGTGASGTTAGTTGTSTVSSGTAIRSGAKSNPLPYEVAGVGQDRDNATAIAYSKTAVYGAGCGGDAGGLISATAYAGGGGIGGVVIIEY